MCSIVIMRGVWEQTPLLVCANRDEALNRPAEGFRHRSQKKLIITSPKDLQAGGTWIGTNNCGVFVGLTNRFSGAPDLKRSSRGELVCRVLACASVDAAIEEALRAPATSYNPCHLVIADRDRHVVFVNTGTAWQTPEVDSKVLIVTERSFGAAPTTRDERLWHAISGWCAQDTAPNNTAIQAMMGLHTEPTFEGVCVHWEARGYGTRMLSVIRQQPSGEFDHFYTDGPPCSHPLHHLAQ